MELKIETTIGPMTAVLIHETSTNEYTAYFKEKDFVMAQGTSTADAIENLHDMLQIVLEYEDNQNL